MRKNKKIMYLKNKYFSRNVYCGNSHFVYTFIEVVIAVAILAFAFTAILGISASATARIVKSQREWADAHRTAQAAEYFLLVGKSGVEIPKDFFPYLDSHASFQMNDPQSLVDGMESRHAGWKLVNCSIRLSAGDGRQIALIMVDKIVKEDDL
jgi:Tfp pilus assembly protein PilE